MKGPDVEIRRYPDISYKCYLFTPVVSTPAGSTVLPVKSGSDIIFCSKLSGTYNDVASDVGVNFKNVGVLSIESSLFHLFHFTFLHTKHQRKGY